MAKNKVSEWSATASNNTDIGGIDIAEGCAPSGINNAIRELMAQVKDMQTGADGDDLTLSGTLALTGGLTLDGAAGTSGQVLLSAGSGNTPTWGNAFVTGMIILWSGSSASIPSGWLLCDGTNSTPDLRNRFVVGAGSTYAVGATGGSANAIVVSHSHTTSDPGAIVSGSATVVIEGNSGLFTSPTGDITLTDAISGKTGGNYNFAGTYYKTFNISGGEHTHTISTEGSSGTNANLPPYYALCYIMKA